MNPTKFKYNLKTLRYERAGISVLSIAFKGIAYLSFGALFFVALVLLQNFIFDTEVEKKLRAENEAMEQHKVVLASRLKASADRIEQLKAEDRSLYEKLFDAKAQTDAGEPTLDKEEILNANSSALAGWIESTTEQARKLQVKSHVTNQYFSESASIEKHELRILKGLPTVPPVEKFDPEKLVSGFGKRINPFHKGLYPHDGVDIAAPIGTNVLAAGPGTITYVSQSNLLAGFGNYVDIDHGNGIVTRYAHLAEVKVRSGQRVNKGQVIATVGSSGGSIAPHLHYEVIKNGKNVNPVMFLIGGLNSSQYQLLVNRSNKQNQSLD
ncbi:MAG: M23 family metallopeptidase [Bacteroidetes bacterium]|nr:M23 family metallopeptidase [Bacteroidota bacterium]